MRGLTGIVILAALAFGAGARAQPSTGKGMTAFRSDAELRAFLLRISGSRPSSVSAAPALPIPSVPAPLPVPQVVPPAPTAPPPPPAEAAPPPPPPPPPPAPSAATSVVVTAARQTASITNNQITGVDEGDIVKLRGDLLVILRRGRLFSVSIAHGRLNTLDHIDAYPPGVDASGDWYDEMLISGDRIVVIGYSYRRNGTQVNRFRLDREGRLRFEDSYQLRSADYYSSRNYASRLIGTVLYFYTPLPLWTASADPLDALPAVRRWSRSGRHAGDWTRLASASHVYAPRPVRERPENAADTLHTVTRCDIAAPTMRCDSTVVLGGDSRSFFVSANAVYIWTQSGGDVSRRPALLYRVPLDASRPSAVAVRGAPVDQFSFSPDAARRALHVLVRAEGGGDAMWRPEVGDGDVALLSLPTEEFGDGETEVALDRYQPLPRPGSGGEFQNRFVGDHLLTAPGARATGPAG